MVERMTAARFHDLADLVSKRHKFNAQKTIVDGIRFDSKAEAKRYCELLLIEKAGEIRQLELQPKFPMKINGVHIGNYTADFAYFQDNERVVEDVKGVETREFRRTKKLIKALYGIDIKVVK